MYRTHAASGVRCETSGAHCAAVPQWCARRTERNGSAFMSALLAIARSRVAVVCGVYLRRCS